MTAHGRRRPSSANADSAQACYEEEQRAIALAEGLLGALGIPLAYDIGDGGAG